MGIQTSVEPMPGYSFSQIDRTSPPSGSALERLLNVVRYLSLVSDFMPTAGFPKSTLKYW